MGKLLEKIFSVKNNNTHKIVRILGLKIKFRNINKEFENLNDRLNSLCEAQNKLLAENNNNQKEILYNIGCNNYINKMNQAAALLHKETFAKYKNKYKDKEIVLIAGGKTVNNFTPIADAIYVGVNRAFKFSKVKLSYLFASDYRDFYDIEELNEIPYSLEKFYGILPHDMLRNGSRSIFIPESIAIRHNAHRFYMKDVADININPKELTMTYDISAFPLTCFASIVSIAMQFILYTNPKKVYLVGCDCNNDAHFYCDKNATLYLEGIMQGWTATKKFVEDYYPETEIISVNPIGLKGLFRDVYTQSYVDEHPELKDENIEIIYEEDLCKNL